MAELRNGERLIPKSDVFICQFASAPCRNRTLPHRQDSMRKLAENRAESSFYILNNLFADA
jgi:hypothetical protein